MVRPAFACVLGLLAKAVNGIGAELVVTRTPRPVEQFEEVEGRVTIKLTDGFIYRRVLVGPASFFAPARSLRVERHGIDGYAQKPTPFFYKNGKLKPNAKVVD